MTESPDVDATGFAHVHGKLRLDGVKLVDSAGQPIQLTGMSSHGLHWFSECYSKESIAFLVQHWGITLFRAALYIDEGGLRTNPGLESTVDDIVRWCEELGIYVIIDFHVLSPGDPNQYLNGRGARSGFAIDFWTRMASKYRSKTHVLYELANEPNGIDWESVKAYHDAVISAIRTIDPETIIICGTTTWSQDIHFAAARPVAQPYNVMYTFHFYVGSHMGLMQRVRDFAKVIPIFVTEWGTSNADGAGGPYLEDALTYLNMLGDGSLGVKISWAQWSYASKNEGSAALQEWACSQRSWDATSCSGTFIRNYIKSHSEARRFAVAGAATSSESSTLRLQTNDPRSGMPSQTIAVVFTVGGLLVVGAAVGVFLYSRKKTRATTPAYDSRTLQGQNLKELLLDSQDASEVVAE